MKNIAEPVFIQVFIPKATVETLNKSVLRWLTWLDKPLLHTMFKGPLIERVAGKFQALIGSYCRRVATKERDTVQNTRDLNPWNPEGSAHRQTLPREIIHTSQALNPTAAGKCIHDKIHRPDQVRRIRADKRKPFSRQTLTTSSALHTQTVKVVNAVYPLVVDVKALPT